MQVHLEQQGFTLVSDPLAARYIIVNTCAFIEAAVEESLDMILELAVLERVKNGQTHLLVTGCLPSRYGEQLVSQLPEVSAFVPVAEEGNIAQKLRELGAKQPDKVSQSDKRETLVTETESTCLAVDPKQPWAYVKISDGCSRRCAYCTIPQIRGPYQSYSFAQITAEVDRLTASGAKEIILIGQDTGIWCEPTPSGELEKEGVVGNAGGVPQTLAQLLDALAGLYPDTWFRVMYLQPEGISDTLLEVMAAHTNIARYFDIPLQHASAKVLTAMNRKGSGEEYLKLIQKIRGVVPNVVLRTTVMTGFPGENQDDFDVLCDFLQQACFDYVGIFAYSCEENTPAAIMPEQVDVQTAFERVQVLRDVADSIGFAQAQRQVASEHALLVCGQDEEGIFGRTLGQAPEVDGLTYVTFNERMKEVQLSESVPRLGRVVRVRIVDAVLYDLFAEVL